MERNKGKLIPTGIDTDNYTDDDFDTLAENNMYVINGEVYRVQWEVNREKDCNYFADVKVNPSGTIDFHMMHYNGGGFWTEVIEDALNEL